MEKVQINLEATLPELRDLYDKGLFTKNEIDDITRRRTAFETGLVKQKVEREDFYRYAEYEINLEQLRKVRWKRLGYDKNPPPRSASSFSLQRRIVYILKRATAKFPSKLSVWLAYVEYASTQGMRKVVLQGLTKALQHHPLSPTLYLLLSYHHLHPGAPFPRLALPPDAKVVGGAVRTTRQQREAEEAAKKFSMDGVQTARTTLLLGLRLLPQSRALWTEYIKLELGWVEGLRRRWAVLGIEELAHGKDKGKEVDDEELVEGEGAFGPDGEDARKAILRGQLIIHAISSALQAIHVDTGPTNEGMLFRRELLAVFRSYPSPLRLRCLETMYAELEQVSASGGAQGAEARLLIVTRRLYDRPFSSEPLGTSDSVPKDFDLIDELGKVGKEIRKLSKTGGRIWGDVAGRWLKGQLVEVEGEELRAYLLSVLSSLTKAAASPSPELLLLHLDCMNLFSPVTSQELLDTTRRHATLYPADGPLQSRHLAALLAQSGPHAVDTRKEARNILAAVTQAGLSTEQRTIVERMWLSYVDWEVQTCAATSTTLTKVWPELLRSSIRHSAEIPTLHARLLGRYFSWLLSSSPSMTPRALIAQIRTYRPSFLFWSIAFLHARRVAEPRSLLEAVHEQLRASAQDADERIETVKLWAGWLVSQKKGVEASRVVDVVRREVRGEAAAESELERVWAEMLDSAGKEQEVRALEDEVEQLIAATDALEDDDVGMEDESEGEDVEVGQLERVDSEDEESFVPL